MTNNDIVTRVPPPLFGYRHTGREMYIDRNGRVREIGGFARFGNRFASFWQGLFHRRIDPSIDHLMPGYIEAIQSALQAGESTPQALASGQLREK